MNEPSLFGRLTTAIPDPRATLQNPIVRYGLYALIAAIIVAVAVMLADYISPFLPFNVARGPSPAARAGKTFWRIPTGDALENLVVPAADAPITTPDTYTVSVQFMIGDSRSPSLGKYRHILHRGSNPCGLVAPATPGSTGQAGIQPGDLPPSTEPSYRDLGLPQIMNPGIFLDRYKNDVHVFIHTVGHEDGSRALWLESTTIADLPLQTPITLSVVCSGKTVEIYVNCRLHSTILLRGTPYLPKSANSWYGRYCAYPMSGIVKNLEIWSDALNSSDLMMVCRAASGGGLNKDDLPSTCPTASGACPDTSLIGTIKTIVSGKDLDASQANTLAVNLVQQTVTTVL
jgi:hypothetical protein